MGQFVGPIRQVMVRGIKKVGQQFVLTMAAYNLVRMRTLAELRRSSPEELKIDEVEAFRLAMVEGRRRGLPWQPPYDLDLQDGRLVFNATSEYEVTIDASGHLRA